MVTLGLVTHFYNEEILLPHWIKLHREIVDDCILIDYASTDNSREIIKSLAPSYWRVVDSRNEVFDPWKVDDEVEEWELELRTDWKFCLNVTEMLWCKDLKQIMEDNRGKDAIGFKSYMMVDSNLNLSLDEPLWKNRTNGYLDDGSAVNSRRGRFMHSHNHGHYNLGRHGTPFPDIVTDDNWNLIFASFSPWPQAVGRKMQIQTKADPTQLAQGFGLQHRQTLETLDAFYKQELSKSNDLLLDKNFKINYDHYISLIEGRN